MNDRDRFPGVVPVTEPGFRGCGSGDRAMFSRMVPGMYISTRSCIPQFDPVNDLKSDLRPISSMQYTVDLILLCRCWFPSCYELFGQLDVSYASWSVDSSGSKNKTSKDRPLLKYNIQNDEWNSGKSTLLVRTPTDHSA